MFLDAEQSVGNARQTDAYHVGYILIAHILQPKEDEGSIENIEAVDSVVQHLNLFTVFVVIVVQVDVDRKWNSLYTTILLSFQVATGVKAHAPYPSLRTAIATEVLEALPKVYQYLLEQVVHLLLVVREEVADGIYRLTVLSDHFSKLSFNVVHQLSFCRSTLLDTQMQDSFQKIPIIFQIY